DLSRLFFSRPTRLPLLVTLLSLSPPRLGFGLGFGRLPFSPPLPNAASPPFSPSPLTRPGQEQRGRGGGAEETVGSPPQISTGTTVAGGGSPVNGAPGAHCQEAAGGGTRPGRPPLDEEPRKKSPNHPCATASSPSTTGCNGQRTKLEHTRQMGLAVSRGATVTSMGRAMVRYESAPKVTVSTQKSLPR
uniref:Uncharacterized protein n=1 Tax=Triticum urartu TaxID=4572 RepID=A0A8R7Q4I7_TRIUA